MTNPTVYVGSGPVHRQAVDDALAGHPWVHLIDAETDPEQAVHLPPSLIPGGHTHVKGLHLLTDAQVRTWAGNASGTSTTGEADKLTANVRKAIAKHATIVDTEPRKGADTRKALDGYAKDNGVSIAARDMAHLAERNTVERAWNIISILAAAGITRPDSQLLADLSSHDLAGGVPWTISSSLESGNTQRALDELSRAEAIPTIAYLAKRATIALLLHDKTPPEQLPALLGSVTDSALRDGEKLARRLNKDRCSTLVEQLAHADALARTGRANEALTIAVSAWA